MLTHCWNGRACRHLQYGHCRFHHPVDHYGPVAEGIDDAFHECLEQSHSLLTDPATNARLTDMSASILEANTKLQDLSDAVLGMTTRLATIENDTRDAHVWKSELDNQLNAYRLLPQ